MALNWIVPARRAVVDSERVTYREAAESWREQMLRYRATLLAWYEPLQAQDSRLPLDLQYDFQVIAMRVWIANTFGAPEESNREDGHPVAADDEPNVVNIVPLNFFARIWRGPLRLVLERRAQEVAREEEGGAGGRGGGGDEGEETIRCDLAGEEMILCLSADQEVLNPDAVFLPGDVLEFPLFKFWARAGISLYEGARFDPQGSFFLGTSVRVGSEGAERPRLHDNMMAMRFQLLLNAGIGAYFSGNPVFVDGGSFASRSNHFRFAGQRINARGMVYGGSLADPLNMGGGADPDRYWLHSNNWGRPAMLPFKAGLNQFPNGGRGEDSRLTWAWSCSPCAKALAFYMVNHQGMNSCGLGGVNQQAWHQDPSGNPILRASGIEYLSACMPDRVLSNVRQRFDNAPADASRAWIRRESVRRMFESLERVGVLSPDEMEPGPASPETADIHGDPEQTQADYILETVEDADPEEEDAEVEDEHQYTEEADTWSDADISGPDPGEPQPEAPEVADGEPVGEQDPRDVYLPVGDAVEIPRVYLQPVLTSVGIQGHEYSIVCVWPPEKLMDNDAENMGSMDSGPPLTGLISAYDPLSGRSFYVPPEPEEAESGVQAAARAPAEEPGEEDAASTGTEDEGSGTPERHTHCNFYLYEAAGSLRRTNINEDQYNVNVFLAKPFRWEAVNRFTLRRMRRFGFDTYIIGENGNERNSQPLASLVRFHKADLLRVYQDPAVYPPVSFHGAAHQELDEWMNNEYYPCRAVPFPMLEEANGHGIYRTFHDVRGAMEEALANLRRINSVSAVRRYLTRQPFSRWVVVKTRELENRYLRGRNQSAVELPNMRTQIQRLESQLRNEGRPTEGAAFDRTVHDQRGDVQAARARLDQHPNYRALVAAQRAEEEARQAFEAARRARVRENREQEDVPTREREYSITHEEFRRLQTRARETFQTRNRAQFRWRQQTPDRREIEQEVQEIRSRSRELSLADLRGRVARAEAAGGPSRPITRDEIPAVERTRIEQEAGQAVAERVVGMIQAVIQALTQDVLP